MRCEWCWWLLFLLSVLILRRFIPKCRAWGGHWAYIYICMCMCKYYIIHARCGFFVSIHLGFVLLHCLCLHGSGMNSGFWTGLGSWNHTNHQISWNRSAFWNPLQNYHLRWRRYYSPDICQMFLIWSAKVSRSLGFAIFIHQKTRCRLKTKNSFTPISNSMHSDAQNDRPKVVTFQYSINGSWFIENQIEPTATSSCSRSIWISMLGSRIDWSN